jgi:hypothetical protein
VPIQSGQAGRGWHKHARKMGGMVDCIGNTTMGEEEAHDGVQ